MTCGRKIGIYDCCTVVCGDCLELMREIPLDSVAVILTDPPYGIGHPCNYRERGRGNLAECRNYPNVMGDDKPFDPTPFISTVPTILWGANHYADKLPPSGGWLVWDKERPDDLDQATCELAWTNCVKGVRRFRHLWNGMIRASDEELIHPTQKPVALMKWCLQLRWIPDGLVLDPFCGSGSTLVAAAQLGRHYLGFEAAWEHVSDALDWLARIDAQPSLFQPVPEQLKL